ncbi:MAG: glycosyltransferase family 2 protein [Coxiellaceae bacterium]|nr:glycosyltransferase family 2 protein [Coxiellaceae bacterium]
MAKISTYIIAYNEADKLEAAINSVLWSDEIVVIDSHSTDNTAQIANRLGARVVQVEFKGFGDLRNQAMAACQYDWIFSLDSDERCTAEARDAILAVVNQSTPTADAYLVPRKNYMMGRWIKHSGWYPNYRQPQLFKRGAISYDDSPVHEKYQLHSDKAMGYLAADIWQMPFGDLSEVMHKANRYSSLGVERLQKKYGNASMSRALFHGLWIFFKLYVLKLGFLDGWAGLVIAIGNFDGTFFRYAKHYEQQQAWQPPSSPPLIKEQTQGEQA